jgi:uncharacterized membrane protein YuzA (DUF378 family)
MDNRTLPMFAGGGVINPEEDLMKKLDVAAAALLVVGGLNWGLVGVARFDLVATIFGDMSPLSRTVYSLVGLAAVYHAVQWRGMQHRWMSPARTASLGARG